jgi:hypothetical protein
MAHAAKTLLEDDALAEGIHLDLWKDPDDLPGGEVGRNRRHAWDFCVSQFGVPVNLQRLGRSSEQVRTVTIVRYPLV